MKTLSKGMCSGTSECTVSQGLLWLWCWYSSGTQEGERALLEAGTGGLVKGQLTGKTRCMCSELQTENSYSARV